MLKFFSRGGSGESSPLPETPSSSPDPPPYSPYTTTPPVASGPARPIRLVYCDDNGKFHMDPEAVAVLQLVKEPVGVVSVCGRARQGKSFILNQVSFFCPNFNFIVTLSSFLPLSVNTRVLGMIR